MQDRARALMAEGLGTMLLVAGVVGSGIMAERLTHDIALALLCNAVATGALLTVLIFIFAPLSGAHFNPAVTLSMALSRKIAPRDAALYIAVQFAGGVAGTMLAHAMFDIAPLVMGLKVRTGTSQWLAEGVATAGLLLTIYGMARHGLLATAAAVGLYITAAYWFTASTSFANPAVTVARAFTATFSGIAPGDAPLFILAQCLAALLITPFANWLFRA
ncbi:MAG: aquaporin family protein [Alphaproteobacteria bacterium]|nr:aquaporin family protein [Alphaproteobacteria bacterium]